MIYHVYIFTYGFASQLGTLIKVSDQTGHFVGFGWVTEFFETHSSGIHILDIVILYCHVFFGQDMKSQPPEVFFSPFFSDEW